MSKHIETIKQILSGDFAKASPDERTRAAREMIEVCAIASGAVAIQPIPLLDIALITPIQIMMVQGVAKVYGHGLDRKAVLELLGAFAAGIAVEQAVLTTAKFVPVIGWVLGLSVAFAMTWAIGEACRHYFERDRQMPVDELKTLFDRLYKTKKAEKQAEHRDNDTLGRKLSQLKEAYKADLLTEEEFERKKQELLENF